MQRREALLRLAAFTTGLTFAPSLLLKAAEKRDRFGTFSGAVSPENMAYLTALCETIIPKTDTPGATEAGVPAFLVICLEECMNPKQAQSFWSALEENMREGKEIKGKDFLQLTENQRIAYLIKVEAHSKTLPNTTPETVNFWRVLKELTMFGYFTSEIGMTQALTYDPVPGSWQDDILITEETKAYAPIF